MLYCPEIWNTFKERPLISTLLGLCKTDAIAICPLNFREEEL